MCKYGRLLTKSKAQIFDCSTDLLTKLRANTLQREQSVFRQVQQVLCPFNTNLFQSSICPLADIQLIGIDRQFLQYPCTPFPFRRILQKVFRLSHLVSGLVPGIVTLLKCCSPAVLHQICDSSHQVFDQFFIADGLHDVLFRASLSDRTAGIVGRIVVVFQITKESADKIILFFLPQMNMHQIRQAFQEIIQMICKLRLCRKQLTALFQCDGILLLFYIAHSFLLFRFVSISDPDFRPDSIEPYIWILPVSGIPGVF